LQKKTWSTAKKRKNKAIWAINYWVWSWVNISFL